VRPRDSKLYCTYLTNAGSAGSSTAALPYGAILLGANTAAPWFYSLAACNLSGATGYPNEPFDRGLAKARARGWRSYEVPCGHDVMLDQPERLAAILREVAAPAPAAA